MGVVPNEQSRFGDMVSNSGLTPWHGIGTVIDEECDGRKALTLARLDWDVRKGMLIDGETFEPIPGRHVLKADFADGTSSIIGEGTSQIVSDTYTIIQNTELADVVDHLQLNVQTAGSMWDGRFVWMLADLGESARFDGSGEDMHRWLMASTWHGSGTFRIEGVNVRVVCENTLRAAQADASAKLFHTIRHTTNADVYLDEAKAALHQTYAAFDEFDEWAASLMVQPYSTADMRRELVPQVFGKFPSGDDVTERKKASAAEQRAVVRGIWNSDTVAPNKWGAIMAVNEYEQHHQGNPSMVRTATKFINNGFALTNKAIKVLA